MSRWSRFWFADDESDRAAVFRGGFFGLFALDAWTQIEHAGRYGAGRFNVSHFPALDAYLPMPTATGVLLAMVLQAWLALRVALGDRPRGPMLALTLLFGWTYFSSQLDSYQHHYLLFLLLAICTGGVWLDAGERLPGWCMRLLRVQVTALYGWAAIAKIDGQWLSGETLQLQITPGWARDGIAALAADLGLAPLQLYGAASVATLGLELVLAAAFLSPRAWRWVWLPGVLFHLSIERLHFEIGLFSYFMVALYTLILPDAPARWLAERGRRAAAATLGRFPDVVGWGPRVGAAAFVALGATLVPIDGAWMLAALLAGLSLLDASGLRGAVVRGLAWLGVLTMHLSTDALRDNYRYMGGDARRRGDLALAIHAYERAVALDPTYTSALIRLGDLYLRDDRAAEALTTWERALALDPNEPNALQRVVTLRAQQGRPDPELARRLRALDPKRAPANAGDDEAQ